LVDPVARRAVLSTSQRPKPTTSAAKIGTTFRVSLIGASSAADQQPEGSSAAFWRYMAQIALHLLAIGGEAFFSQLVSGAEFRYVFRCK